MRRMLIIATLLLAPFSALAGPKEDGQAVFEKFLSGFTSGNPDTVAGLFTPDAVFWGTVARDLISSPNDIHQYFVNAFKQFPAAKASAVGSPSVVVLSDDAVVVAGIWQVEVVLDGKSTIRQNRNSITVVRRGDRWLIAAFNNSPRPPAP